MRFIAIFLLSIFLQSAHGQEVKKLFQTEEVIAIELRLPLKDVTRDLREKEEHPAILSYLDQAGQKKEFNVKVSTRGKTRKKVCAFPPLELNFKKKELSESIFAGQNKIKLVTHCKNSKSFEKYIEKEYAVYKLYQHVVPYSYQVRMIKIDYIDEKRPEETNQHLAFMVEEIKDLARRNHMKVFKENIVNQEVLEKENLDKMVMFEFLIGNLDWSIPERHNVKLIKGENKGLPVAVPYDFDYSGMVNTPYAVPPDGIDIENVRIRKFRGLCRQGGYGDTISYYMEIKQDLYNELQDANYLSPQGRDEMIAYLDSFYRLISDKKSVRTYIDRACRAKHKHIYEYN